jgi:2'-5' RNA ligase/SHS2 domain-containing protein
MDERLFLALEVGCPWPDVFPSGRILLPEHRHLTLAFLGFAESKSLIERLPQLPDPGFRIGFSGYFDAPLFLPKNRPRTAGWHVHLFEREELFTAFQKKLVFWLSESGFPPQNHHGDFLAHVTIARNPTDHQVWIGAFSKLPLYLKNIQLYKSLGQSKYEILWSHQILAPFQELEHTADIAFLIRGESLPQLYLHASLALAFYFPPLLRYMEKQKKVTSLENLIMELNELVTKADSEGGCPFKAVSFHGCVKSMPDGILEWEMIVDV